METLKEASRGSTATGQRLRAGLLIAEVSLSLVLRIGAGLLLSSFARLQRVEVDPADPLIYIAVSVTLLLVAEFASWLPARRATRIDPVAALRME